MCEVGGVILELVNKSMEVLKREGISGLAKHASHYIHKKRESRPKSDAFKDVLFINGCPRDLLPHPPRYRVTHQMEQLKVNGYTCDEVFFENVDLKQVRMYSCFIIFRAPYTDKLDAFIQLAKSWNKPVLYDVDDLVIDTKYTDQIAYVKNMEASQKARYDLDVMKNQKLLKLCDGCITTTLALKKELEKYNPNVWINRNTASIEMVTLSQEIKKTSKDTVDIGYFSGSITHNEDFEMIKPALIHVLNAYNHVRLHLVGEIDLPQDLKMYASKIEVHPFMDYKKLPELISKMDINLAPLTSNIFNEAKSENKWVEASLVNTCTIASNLGAFKEMIEDHKTGILCSNIVEWKKKLTCLIENKELRETLAGNAYAYCLKHCVTLYTGSNIVSILQENRKRIICMGFAKLEISGGVMVALRHAAYLQDAGYQVMLLSFYDTCTEFTFMNHSFPVLPFKNEKLDAKIDCGVATMWPTVKMLDDVRCIENKKYLVQGYEVDFYDFKDPRKVEASVTYSYPFDCITVSKWCKEWLKSEFNKDAKWIYNGIDIEQYKNHKREFNGKIRILIEGDSSSKYKNVDETFTITNKLDSSKYEIWYMSYNAKPKDWYRVDKFLHRVPYEEVQKVYANCDILLKTSLLESFSYPPLEMMATGGYVVALLNDGNKEYLEDGKNCLIYTNGDIDKAVHCIERIVSDQALRDVLYTNGVETAKSRDWNLIKESIIRVYCA